ncbi:MAG: hypothetical protein WD070_01185, partial [Pirellulaceae bacterium]
LTVGQGRLNAELDKFGNPVGAHGLAADGAFRGKRLLLWGGSSGPGPIFASTNPLLAMLKQKGFEVQIQQRAFDPAWLNQVDQLWIFSGPSSQLTPDHARMIEAFVKGGKGLYLVADNAPFTAEADLIGKQMFGVSVEGDYAGTKTIAVRQELDGKNQPSRNQASRGTPPRSSKADLLNKLPGLGATIQNSQVSHFVRDHALLTGINYIYEGITISHLSPNDQLETVLLASDGQILASVAKDKRLRLIVDCGYTRYFPEYINETAGTLRYAENVAAYLMGVGGEKPLDEQTVAELLATSVDDDKATRRAAAIRQLKQGRPAYSDVKDDIETLWQYLDSDNQEVAHAAREQLALAFQQAPVSHCLHWIAQSKAGLSELIWEQLEVRIGRADATRRESYHTLALRVVQSDRFETSARLAALQLLSRLKNPASLSPLSDSLVELPRELWPAAGAVLHDLSGQDFGPRTGDQLADVVGISKK